MADLSYTLPVGVVTVGQAREMLGAFKVTIGKRIPRARLKNQRDPRDTRAGLPKRAGVETLANLVPAEGSLDTQAAVFGVSGRGHNARPACDRPNVEGQQMSP
jgi:hypothetical protein